jgi:hypothetical protein
VAADVEPVLGGVFVGETAGYLVYWVSRGDSCPARERSGSGSASAHDVDRRRPLDVGRVEQPSWKC